MINTDTIEQVKAKTKIVDVISQFVKLKKKGADHVGLCPFHNEKTPSFSVSAAKDLYKCFGCGKSGDSIGFLMDKENKTFAESIEYLADRAGVEIQKEAVKKEFIRPVPRLEKIGSKAISWFETERKISNNTLLRFQITEAMEWMPQFEKEVVAICFNYFRDGQLINIKFRGPKKSFKLAKDSELIFYNLDAIKDQAEAIITEGEIDTLTAYECGFYNAVSVPNGAEAVRLEYLNNCWKSFEGKTKIILATDADAPGNKLRDELCRRLGADRCYQVKYPEGCKDLNSVLQMHGPEAVKKCIQEAIRWPLLGVITMDEIFPTVEDWFQNGYPTGAKTHIPGMDNLLTFGPGQLTVITGIPGHGKDEFTNWIMANLARHEDWTWGVLGFEETPAETVTKLTEKIAGKAFAYRKDLNNRMNSQEFENAIGLVDKYFYMINADDIDGNIDSILDIATGLVVRYGIKGLYINPWNWLEHNRPAGMNETEYVSLVLSKIIRWARKYQIHIILLAHTTKILKDKNDKFSVPNLYSISGSANFFNKVHNGITVYRDYQKNITDVHVQKVKQSWYGQIGYSSYRFNTLTRAYEFLGCSVEHSFEKVVKEKPPELFSPVQADEPLPF